MQKKKVLKISGYTLGVISIVALVTVLVLGYLDNSKKNESKDISNKLENSLDDNSDSMKKRNTDETKEMSEEDTDSSETVTEEMTMLETEESETTSQVQTSPDIVEMNTVMYGTASGNIRTGASTNYTSVGKISYGESVEVTGKDNEWYRINYNGQAAYIHETLLSENQPQQPLLQNSQSEQNQSTQSQPTQSQSTQQQPTQSTQQQPTQSQSGQNPPSQSQPETQQPSQSQQEQSKPVQSQPQRPTQSQTQTTPDSSSSYVDEVIRLVNVERNKEGLSSLSKNVTLCEAAQTRASEIITVFDHTRPDGTSCFTVTDDYKIKWTAIGENIAKGQKSPQEVVEAWMNSPGHRANILNSNFNQIGVGVVQSGGYYYWAQLFIRAA